MDEDTYPSDAELTEVFDHLQSTMDTNPAVRMRSSDPEQRRIHWSRSFQHLADLNRLTPLRDDRS